MPVDSMVSNSYGVQAIEAREGNSEGAFVQYECKCSFLQIYNEELSDLLCPSEHRRLTIRTSSGNNSNAHDVWVDNLTEHVVLNGTFEPQQCSLNEFDNQEIKLDGTVSSDCL